MSRSTLILSRADVEKVATMEMAVKAVEQAFAAHAKGEAKMPPKVYLDLPEHQGDFRAMPSSMKGAAGVKWVNSHPKNPERFDLPSVMGVYVLSDPASAYPVAILDATLLTALRTGAAAGVASKYLASKPSTVGYVGCGVQARFLHRAHQVVFGEFEALVADASDEAAKAFAEEIGGRVVSLEEAAGADIVNTSTPVRAPIVERSWVAVDGHINAMGADGPGKQELDAKILLDATVVIDEAHQAEHSGEINVPIAAKQFHLEDVAGTLGQVVAGMLTIGKDRLTVFDSTGLAIQDVALAKQIVGAAKDAGVGTSVDLVGA